MLADEICPENHCIWHNYRIRNELKCKHSIRWWCWNIATDEGPISVVQLIFHLVEQGLSTLPEHLSSSPVFSEVRVTWSLLLCACFVDRCLSFYPLSFWPLRCLSFFHLRIMIAPLVSSKYFSQNKKEHSKWCNLQQQKTTWYDWHNLLQLLHINMLPLRTYQHHQIAYITI